MPIFPHINMDGAPDWMRATVAIITATYVIFMLSGAYILWRKSEK